MNSFAGGVSVRIFSRVEDLEQLPIGVDIAQPASPVVDVRVDKPNNVWTPDRAGDMIFRFSVGDYRYTGGRPGGNVVASNYYQTGVEWYISKQDEDTYTISPNYDHSIAWTISNPDSDHPTVALRPLRLPAEPSQLFKFQALPQ